MLYEVITVALGGDAEGEQAAAAEEGVLGVALQFAAVDAGVPVIQMFHTLGTMKNRIAQSDRNNFV